MTMRFSFSYIPKAHNKHNSILQATIQHITTKGLGILAADESVRTITQRLASVHVEADEEARRSYRELLLSTPELNQYIAGVILFEETLGQSTTQGTPFPKLLLDKVILPGIKVDRGLVPLTYSEDSEEKISQGLDGLFDRLAHYREQGATFAKWRATYTIDSTARTPTQQAINANAFMLARYAYICQSQGIVPIVEPEVLMAGHHTLIECQAVTTEVLHAVFDQLHQQNVQLEYIILKPNMIIPGKHCPESVSVQAVAEATVQTLQHVVPVTVPTINFLSGGQTPEQSTAHLNAINTLKGSKPWNLSFSYARALQEPCLQTWQGQPDKVVAAQQALLERARLNSLASMGQYSETMESVLTGV